MPRNSMTFMLDGEVSLAAFDTAVRSFREAVEALTAEVAPSGQIEWVVDVLETGSAMLGVRGRADDDLIVDAVVDAFETIGEAYERGELVPYSPRVSIPFDRMVSVVSGVIPSIRFETAERDFVITAPPPQRVVFREVEARRSAYGAVRGRIQTLSSRNHLRFTLYDRLDNRAVSCYLREGQQDLMRNAWDKLASVEGIVTRDSLGRPTGVRQVTSLEILPEPRGNWRAARGAVPWSEGDEPAERTIRRFRDA
ncbi:MAG: hypothetical protein JWN67_4683 [Actinomycetia bacterium]|nr:hypothetical protein [Actinomycetes bacterium]